MRRTLIIVIALVAMTMLVAAGNGSGRNFQATLSGAEEVPPVVTETSGRASFHANQAETEIRFKLRIKNGNGILGAAGAHIHCAPAGSNGPVVAFLAGVVAGGLDGNVDITATLTDANIVNSACGATVSDLLDSMQAGDAYVNVHSIANPSGEVRGQIH